ncbi:MAG: exodeoxyribonuclease-3 [Planctomycetota bacterium]|jgi:exodeoxyribonuclease-3
MAKKNQRGFTICSLNLNGIRAAEKHGFGEWLAREKPDVLCTQEVRAQTDQVPDEVRSPAGYNTRWNSAVKKGYAGTALFTREAPDSYQVGSGLDWGDLEGRALRASFPDLEVISLYVPSGSSSEERLERKFEYMKHMTKWFAKLLKENRPIAVCGDFNVAHTELDIWSPKTNVKNSGFLPEERNWFSKLLAQGWRDVVREQNPGAPGLYSWWSTRGQAREKDRGWRLDYCLMTPSLADRVTNAWVEKDAGLSDHAPVWIELADK